MIYIHHILQEKRQKQCKLAEIKAKISQYLKGLQKAGLTATCLQLESVEAKSVNIQLADLDVSIRPTKQTIRACNEKNKTLLHTLMKNNISIAVYHEISIIFLILPGSCICMYTLLPFTYSYSVYI